MHNLKCTEVKAFSGDGRTRRYFAAKLVSTAMRHDLPEAEKHCGCCGKDLRLFDEEFSERYEYISASIKVIKTCGGSTPAIAP